MLIGVFYKILFAVDKPVFTMYTCLVNSILRKWEVFMKKYIRAAFCLLLAALIALLPIAFAQETAPDAAYVELKAGDSGEGVLNANARLNKLGYLKLTPGSGYDALTEKAVKAFQEKNGLEVTGILTPQDQEFLFSEAVIPATYTNADESERIYIGNSHTHKYHYESCDSVRDIKEKNRVRLSKAEAEAGGYVPCKRCNP